MRYSNFKNIIQIKTMIYEIIKSAKFATQRFLIDDLIFRDISISLRDSPFI